MLDFPTVRVQHQKDGPDADQPAVATRAQPRWACADLHEIREDKARFDQRHRYDGHGDWPAEPEPPTGAASAQPPGDKGHRYENQPDEGQRAPQVRGHVYLM